VAITVTPEIVRVVFLRKMGRRRFVSFGVKMPIKSAFDGTSSSWYFAEVFIFRRFTSSRVGCGVSISVFMISRKAFSSFKAEGTKIRFR